MDMPVRLFISQEIVSCETKSLRQDAQLAERKLPVQPARARNKSCAVKVVARGVCEAHFCFHRKLRPVKQKASGSMESARSI